MANIIVNCRVIDDQYSPDDRELACTMLNNILSAISRGEYVEGYRNNMAVDLACAAHVLHVDAMEVVQEPFKSIPDNAMIKLELKERIDQINGYVGAWDCYSRNGVFDKMKMPWEWKGEPDVRWVLLKNNG